MWLFIFKIFKIGKNTSKDKIQLIIELRKDGKTLQEISDKIDRKISTIYNIIKKYEKQEKNNSQEKRGRNKKLNNYEKINDFEVHKEKSKKIC